MVTTATLAGLKIGLCQQPCLPAQPEYNGSYFQGCIEDAEDQGVDLLVGVEGIQGYLIGDQYEYNQFLNEVQRMNIDIRHATKDKKVVVAYGSVLTDLLDNTGEDGRIIKHNGGYILERGLEIDCGNKTLSPCYRMFPEPRYFLDNRKIAESMALRQGIHLKDAFKHLLRPVPVMLRNGLVIRLGQEFCEDMWHEDYEINPTLILAENGADIIVNHSASPWTWRKNNKRHRVVKDLMQSIPVEIRPKLFIYVNRTGVEQSNKNFYIYDGSSAIYDSDGDLIFEMPPYYRGTKVFTFTGNDPKIEGHTPDDTKALCDAMGTVVDDFFGRIPEERRFVLVGLSGGIDSSLMAALLVSQSALGPKRVIGVNMPYDDYNTQDTIDDAEMIAKNLGTLYLKIDITNMVNAIANATGVQKGSLAHSNIIARCRMEVLAALAQKEEVVNGLVKKGGLFTANGNKVEMAFGFGTLYADIAGAIMLLGDLIKRDEYLLADYLNRVVFGREVIPQSVFDRPPLAALDEQHSVDPFDYGTLEHRGYHDEWVRAVTEFRRDPMWFLEEYAAGTLEKTFLLPEGHLQKLFPTPKSFIQRLEEDWIRFTSSYFKRMQCPPVPVFSRRAFGGDLSESLYGFDHQTEDFKCLKAKVLKQ